MSDEFKDFHDVPLTEGEKELVADTVAEGVENKDKIINQAASSRARYQLSNSKIGSKGFNRAKEEFRDKCGNYDSLGKIRQCLADDIGDKAATSITEAASKRIHKDIDRGAEIQW